MTARFVSCGGELLDFTVPGRPARLTLEDATILYRAWLLETLKASASGDEAKGKPFQIAMEQLAGPFTEAWNYRRVQTGRKNPLEAA